LIQSNLGGGLRRPNGGEIGGRAHGGGVAISWVVWGRLADDGRTPLFFCETFISYGLWALWMTRMMRREGYEKRLDSVKCGAGMNARKGNGNGDSPATKLG